MSASGPYILHCGALPREQHACAQPEIAVLREENGPEVHHQRGGRDCVAQGALAIDTFYQFDKFLMSEFLSFQSQEVASKLPGYGSTKGVVSRNGTVKVVCTLISPLLIEICRSSHGRIVLAATFNLCTLNDLGGMQLPPLFHYAVGERGSFQRLIVQSLMGMVNNQWKLSTLMLQMLPPAYQCGEAEREDMEESEGEREEEEEVVVVVEEGVVAVVEEEASAAAM
eukprot:5872742-Pleurochrysis_carterae.AAC.1